MLINNLKICLNVEKIEGNKLSLRLHVKIGKIHCAAYPEPVSKSRDSNGVVKKERHCERSAAIIPKVSSITIINSQPVP